MLDGLLCDPDAAAIVTVAGDFTATWTRSELLRMAAGAIEVLDANDVAPGECVPALLTTQPASVALLLAGAWSHRPLAPLGPRLTEHELRDCIDRLDSTVLVAEPESAELAAQLADETGRRLVITDALAPGGPIGPADFAAEHGDVAFVMHTSGTTGAPKQVPAREGPLARRAEVNGTLLGLRPGARLVIGALFHHVAGLGNIAVALANHCAIVMFPSFSVPAWQSLKPFEPTHVITVPSVIEILMAANALMLPSIRLIAYGGAPIHPDTARRVHNSMPHVDLVQLFGQTEGSPLTVLSPEDHRAAARGNGELLRSVGRAAPGVELRIVDPGPDGVGEVWARCDHSLLTDADGWQHTGDLGRLADGYLYLVGRSDDKIIRGGENVFPVEVERVLENHPQVAEAAVVGVADQRLGETIRAYIVAANPASRPDVDELRTYCRQQLAGFKVPAQWRFAEALPRNAAGKLMRRQLVSPQEQR
ncbi:class I adenylate-forming enzyme family protein [Mycobacterium heckeshornense]|uniref:Acyl-CoA synthetase n=1 Tax=Mycobacterium heckeshornense TaxID=110505 RepID=A0A7R7GQS6_9MYCO|nr:class I adenylate-forming enzyme family protein [Mycobacterium heckeshornense]BCO34212.1 acyl-CoA synthetase [Mycobacterium heckeshornense]